MAPETPHRAQQRAGPAQCPKDVAAGFQFSPSMNVITRNPRLEGLGLQGWEEPLGAAGERAQVQDALELSGVSLEPEGDALLGPLSPDRTSDMQSHRRADSGVFLQPHAQPHHVTHLHTHTLMALMTSPPSMCVRTHTHTHTHTHTQFPGAQGNHYLPAPSACHLPGPSSREKP